MRHDHTAAVNFGSVGQIDGEPDSDHLEFRLFDASWQAGRMQAQVKLGPALTDYAVRHRDEPAGPRRPVGVARQAAAHRAAPSSGWHLGDPTLHVGASIGDLLAQCRRPTASSTRVLGRQGAVSPGPVLQQLVEPVRLARCAARRAFAHDLTVRM